MKNNYITVVESEDGSTLKDVYLWDKMPKKEGDSFMNESDNICLKLPKNIATYILNSIGNNCTYEKQECFKINFEKVEDENSYLATQSDDASVFFKENINDFYIPDVNSAFYKICKRISLQHRGKTKTEIFNKTKEACCMAILLDAGFKEIIYKFSNLFPITVYPETILTLSGVYDIIEKLNILKEIISTYGIVAEESTDSVMGRKRINQITADEKIVKFGLIHVFKLEETIEKTKALWEKLANIMLLQEAPNALDYIVNSELYGSKIKIKIPKG